MTAAVEVWFESEWRWRDHRLLVTLLASLFVHFLLIIWYQPARIQWNPATEISLYLEPVPDSEPVSIPIPIPIPIPTPKLKPEVSSTTEKPQTAAPPIGQVDDRPVSPPDKSQLQWEVEGKQAAQELVRSEADVARRRRNQWFRAPSMMWGDVPRVFDREYILTQNEPTGLLGDPTSLFSGGGFKGLGVAIGSCFLGLPKVDVEQNYYEHSKKFATVYPDEEVVPLSLFSCGF